MSGKPGKYHSYLCEGVIPPYRLANFGVADNSSKQAVDAASPLIGVTQIVGGEDGLQVDICRDGLPEVQYGGVVTKGDRLTSDADGKAIATVTAGDWVIGIAEVSGVEDDIGMVFISPDKI